LVSVPLAAADRVTVTVSVWSILASAITSWANGEIVV
jgi:hypothetical protein